MKDMDNLVFKLLLPISLSPQHLLQQHRRAVRPAFFPVLLLRDAALVLRDLGGREPAAARKKAMVGAFTRGAFRGSRAILGMAL